MGHYVSKESRTRKKLARLGKNTRQQKKAASSSPGQPRKSPVAVPGLLPQRARRKLSRKFIITSAIWIIALGVALYFLSR